MHIILVHNEQPLPPGNLHGCINQQSVNMIFSVNEITIDD